MTGIPLEEVKFHPHSFADPAGRLFYWNGELYRGLTAASAALFSKLLHDGTLQRLAEEGLLIDTWSTDFSLAGFELIVRHRGIPFASYPQEWCPAMLKDAALTLLDLLLRLAGYGLTLKDSHPWNLLFDWGRAVYVDLTSIIPIRDDQWHGYDEFCRFYRNPLILMANGQERIARSLLPEYEGVLGSDVVALTGGGSALLWEPLRNRLKKARDWIEEYGGGRHDRGHLRFGCRKEPTEPVKSLVAFFRQIKEQIEALVLPSGSSAAHAKADPASFAAPETWSSTQGGIRQILDQIRSSSLLDLGSPDSGWYSRGISASGSTALAVSTDSSLLTELYREARRSRLPLLPVMMDFTDPTPSRGLRNHWSIAASERLKTDVVLALADVLRYSFERSLNFEQIVEGAASFSKHWLITEFVPAHEIALERTLPLEPSRHNLENFVTALERRFHRVTSIPISDSGRALLTCEK